MNRAVKRHYVGEKGRIPIVDYNEIRETDSHEARAAKMEYYSAKSIGEKLVATYPGRQWSVNVDLRNEMIVIACPSVSLTKGYHLAIRRDTLAQLQTRAVRAAGEILERYGVTRGRLFDASGHELLTRGVRDELKVTNPADTAPTKIVRL